MPNLPIVPTEPAGATDNKYLTYMQTGFGRRLDWSEPACKYYEAIGAVESCGGIINTTSLGALINPITFQQWKNDVGIDNDAFHPNIKTDVAHFINQVDLNLTRDHHMIVYSHNFAAAYVCNHKGSVPTAADPTGLFPPQSEIDALIKDIKTVPTTNAIACVAMEFSTRGKRGAPPSAVPFTKFYIFGPDGALWSTVDLDGRGPKGVPNVCTACHGGKFDYENLAGGFDPTIATTRYDAGTNQFKPGYPGDLGAHFLPFDMGNFAFASDVTPDQREDAIFRMNRDVYEIERNRWHVGASGFVDDGFSSLAIYSLIAGWYYESALLNPPIVAPHFTKDYIPPRWNGDFIHSGAYTTVYSHSCRTCHVAMDRANGENDPNVFVTAKTLACDQPTSFTDVNKHVMPNSKVTFDRFWLSQDFLAPIPLTSLTDQPSSLAKLIPNPIPDQPLNGPFIPPSNNPAVACPTPIPSSD